MKKAMTRFRSVSDRVKSLPNQNHFNRGCHPLTKMMSLLSMTTVKFPQNDSHTVWFYNAPGGHRTRLI